MKITEVKLALANQGTIRAFATITVDNCLAIHDLRIIEGPKGLFVAMPSKLKDGTYRDIVHPVNAETRETIERTLLAEYKKVAARNS